jgi:ligand-binding sensor domain-containing protein
MPFQNMIAIGTTGGLTITDMANTWTSYTAQHREWAQRNGQILEDQVPGNSPLPGNIINALAASDNFELLFVGTDKGLGVLNGSEWLDVGTIMPGIPRVAITGLAWLNGDLWVATGEGIFQVKKVSSLIQPVAKP